VVSVLCCVAIALGISPGSSAAAGPSTVVSEPTVATTAPPTAAMAAPVPAPVAPATAVVASPVHPVVPTGATQVVVVSAPAWGSASATVTAYEWDGVGWRVAIGPVVAGIGHNGLTATPHENDGYTPIGEYSFTTVFGAQPNPGMQLPYTRVTNNDHWVDDPGSPLYNTFQTGPAAGRWTSAETLSSYSYAAAFDFNQDPVVAGGNSAIFLHEGGGPTPGCIEVPRSDLLRLLRWLAPSAHPVIVLGVNASPPQHIAAAG
jgi:L,D-peptidoglycan transpeptidase YkuD (ErfK/YbiS/YcfS/YnhG family)